MLKKFVVKCPPEVILRPIAKRTTLSGAGTTTVFSKSPVMSSNFTQRRHFKAAMCTEIDKPLSIGTKESQMELSSGEVRVEVAAAGINFGDILMTKGTYQVKLPTPFTPGNEMAGTILEVADDVVDFKPGMRVVGLVNSFGAFAEEVVTQAESLWMIPDEMEFTDAAGFIVSYGTAMLGLKHRANIQPGEHLLVTAAAGGAGLAAVDIGSHVLEARVIGAAGTEEKCSLVKSYGAVDCINYTTENVRDRTKEISPKGANVVFDTVGGKIFKDALRSIAWEGRLLVIGFASGDIPSIPANHLLVKNVSAVGFYWGAYSMTDLTKFRWSVDECLRQYRLGKLKPHICKKFDLSMINQAMDFVKSRKSTGKVVLVIR
uniref:Quinone oxidoreductase-like protein 2 homolog n=1 Tax=Phallusia mammillata TaxID=59560 RepID=A0A6F9D9G8_9ASCI|nr:quinone oxidoreductase-like protein 2 homolog [Phallusia mammillata]